MTLKKRLPCVFLFISLSFCGNDTQAMDVHSVLSSSMALAAIKKLIVPFLTAGACWVLARSVMGFTVPRYEKKEFTLDQDAPMHDEDAKNKQEEAITIRIKTNAPYIIRAGDDKKISIKHEYGASRRSESLRINFGFDSYDLDKKEVCINGSLEKDPVTDGSENESAKPLSKITQFLSRSSLIVSASRLIYSLLGVKPQSYLRHVISVPKKCNVISQTTGESTFKADVDNKANMVDIQGISGNAIVTFDQNHNNRIKIDGCDNITVNIKYPENRDPDEIDAYNYKGNFKVNYSYAASEGNKSSTATGKAPLIIAQPAVDNKNKKYELNGILDGAADPEFSRWEEKNILGYKNYCDNFDANGNLIKVQADQKILKLETERKKQWTFRQLWAHNPHNTDKKRDDEKWLQATKKQFLEDQAKRYNKFDAK